MPEPMTVADWGAARTEVDTHPMEGVEPAETATAVAEPEKAAPDTEIKGSAAPATPEKQAQAVAAVDAAAAAGATKAEQREMMEAILDGKPYPIPKGLVFKLKAGSATEERKLDDLLSGGMRDLDYRRKTTEVARRSRDVSALETATQARAKALEAREAWLKEQQAEMAEAMKDPAKWEQYQELQRLAASNPRVAKMLEDAIAKRETDARLQVFEESAGREEATQGAEAAVNWITDMAKEPEFALVDPDKVRMLHSRELIANPQWDNTPEHVRAIFQTEAKYLASVTERSLSPLQKQLDELRAQLNARETAAGQDAHNARTARALDRSKAPNTAPSGGTPPGPARVEERRPIPPNRAAHEKAVSDWAKVRD